MSTMHSRPLPQHQQHGQGTQLQTQSISTRTLQHVARRPEPPAPSREQRRHASPASGDWEYAGDGLSGEEVSKFERIAQSLATKLSNLQDEVEESDVAAAEAEDNGLLPFGITPEQASSMQTKKQQAAKQQASSNDGADGFAVPRAQRRSRRLPDAALPKVAIVGRPNVGKSCLFNRIAGASLAVVYDEPGVTRDRLYTRAQWGSTEFVLVDTGGLMSSADHLPAEQRDAALRSTAVAALPQAIERQAAAGVAESDVVVLLVDGRAGLQAGDREILGWLRTNHPAKALLLAVNKCDHAGSADLQAAEFWELGLEPLPLSAINGSGTGELLDALVQAMPPPKDIEAEEEQAPLAVAIVGRPNVGKSSLLNCMCGEERVIVCDLSGTTRDAVDTEVVLPGGQRLKLIDTAGIRKRTKVAGSKDGAEQLSVERALRAMRRAEVVVAVVDATEGITQQDFRLTELAAQEGRAVVVVVNKWDKVDTRVWSQDKYAEDVRAQLRHVSWAEVVCTNASKGRAVPDVVEAVLAAGAQHRRRVSTATLNLVVKEATAWKAPPTQRGSGKKGRIYYATQAGIQPPTFVFFVNEPSLIGDDYKRYVERALRDNIGLSGTPLRILWRGKPQRERPPPPSSRDTPTTAGSRS